MAVGKTMAIFTSKVQVITRYVICPISRTHTPAKRGDEAVAYQGQKSCKTSNMLILSDVNGIPIACSEPASC